MDPAAVSPVCKPSGRGSVWVVIKSAATLRLTDLQDVRAVAFALDPRIAAPVRDFAIELDDEMYTIDGKLGDGAGAKLKSAVETGPLDDAGW